MSLDHGPFGSGDQDLHANPSVMRHVLVVQDNLGHVPGEENLHAWVAELIDCIGLPVVPNVNAGLNVVGVFVDRPGERIVARWHKAWLWQFIWNWLQQECSFKTM